MWYSFTRFPAAIEVYLVQAAVGRKPNVGGSIAHRLKDPHTPMFVLYLALASFEQLLTRVSSLEEPRCGGGLPAQHSNAAVVRVIARGALERAMAAEPA